MREEKKKPTNRADQEQTLGQWAGWLVKIMKGLWFPALQSCCLVRTKRSHCVGTVWSARGLFRVNTVVLREADPFLSNFLNNSPCPAQSPGEHLNDWASSFPSLCPQALCLFMRMSAFNNCFQHTIYFPAMKIIGDFSNSNIYKNQ